MRYRILNRIVQEMRPSEKERASVNIVNVLFQRLLGIIIGIFPAVEVKRAAQIYVRYRYYDVFALTSVYVSICVTTSAKEKSLSLIPLMNPVKNHSAMRVSRLLATQGCLMNQRLTLKKMNWYIDSEANFDFNTEVCCCYS